MFGAEVPGHRSGMLRLIELRVVEADRERAGGPRAHLLHQRHDEGRIDATREERTDRHVRDHAPFHGVFQQDLQLGVRFLAGHVHGVRQGNRDRIPVLTDGQSPRLIDRRVGRRQLPCGEIDRVWRRHISVTQIQPEGIPVNRPWKCGVCSERLELGREREPAIGMAPVIQWLFAEPVA